jgi:hypothetical protein
LHPGRELLSAALDNQVVVVAEQAKGVHGPAAALDDDPEQAEEEAVVVVVQVDVAAVNSARTHVVDPVGKHGARDAGHGGDASAQQRRFRPWGQKGPVL